MDSGALPKRRAKLLEPRRVAMFLAHRYCRGSYSPKALAARFSSCGGALSQSPEEVTPDKFLANSCRIEQFASKNAGNFRLKVTLFVNLRRNTSRNRGYSKSWRSLSASPVFFSFGVVLSATTSTLSFSIFPDI